MPIISFSSKGSDEIVKNGINGILVNQGDISNFVDQICQINKNRNIIDNMKSNCLDSIAKFDLDVNIKRLVTIYKKLN